MAKTLDQRYDELSPERQANVDAHMERMLVEVHAYRLRELREQQYLTQSQIAEQTGVSQRRVSGIERGDVEKTQVDTLRKYVEAIGGTLHVEADFNGDRYKIA